MRIGIEFPENTFQKLVEIIDVISVEERSIDDILITLLNSQITSSDLLFVALQKLEEMKIVRGTAGKIKVTRPLSMNEKNELINHVKNFVEKNSSKLFLTPLEISKFFQCPRRLFLEKIVLSKQQKEKRGRTWDGEILHKSVYLLIRNLLREDLKEEIPLLVEKVLKEYEGKYTLEKEEMIDFLFRFLDFIREENFKIILPETTFISFKLGLMGTPDIVAIKEDGEIIPIDLKLGELKEKIKEEHLIQNIGEGLLVESFFRKKVERCILIYYSTKNIGEIKLQKKFKKKFLDLKKRIVRTIKYGKIPSKSVLPNFTKRVCPGCHVKEVCEHIEKLKKAVKKL